MEHGAKQKSASRKISSAQSNSKIQPSYLQHITIGNPQARKKEIEPEQTSQQKILLAREKSNSKKKSQTRNYSKQTNKVEK